MSKWSKLLKSIGAGAALGATLTPEDASAAGITTIAKRLGVGLEEAAKIKQLAIDKVPQSVLDDNIRAIQMVSQYKKQPELFEEIGNGMDIVAYQKGDKVLKVPSVELKDETEVFPSIVENVGLGPKTKTIETNPYNYNRNRYQVQDLVKPLNDLGLGKIRDKKLDELQNLGMNLEKQIAKYPSKELQTQLDTINDNIKLYKIELAKKAGIPVDEIIQDYSNADALRQIQYKTFGDIDNIDDIMRYPQIALEAKIHTDAVNNLSDFVTPKDLHTGNIGLDLKNRPTIFDTSRFSDVQYQNLTPEMKQNIIDNYISKPAERQLLQQRLNSSDTMKKAAAVAPGLALTSDEDESSLGNKLSEAGSYVGEKAMQGLHALGAPQRYIFDKAATSMDVPSNPEDSEETAFNMIEAASNKLGLPEDSTALNAAKAASVAGLDVLADPLALIPLGKFDKLRKAISP